MTISAKLKAQYQDEAMAELSTIDRLEAEAKSDAQERRAEIKRHRAALARARALAEGREFDQLEIPTAGAVKPRQQAPVKPPAPRPAKPAARKLLYGYGPDQCGDRSLDGSRCQLALGHDGAHEAEGSGGHRVTWRSGPARPAKKALGDPLPVVYGTARVRGEITRWKADERARKVPNFVIEQTGLKTKAQVIAKYGDGVTFEKGKPAPKDSRPGPKKPDHLARHMAERAAERKSVAWTEGDGTQQVKIGTITYRAQEITPTRWVLESKGDRERAWHKDDVLPNLAACEARIMRAHLGVTFAEKCLDCGVAADQPSEGCEGCAHGKAAARG